MGYDERQRVVDFIKQFHEKIDDDEECLDEMSVDFRITHLKNGINARLLEIMKKTLRKKIVEQRGERGQASSSHDAPQHDAHKQRQKQSVSGLIVMATV